MTMTAPLGPAATPLTVQWVPICAYDDLVPERGVVALVGDRQVAVFRVFEGEVYAVDNADPFSGAYVMARGIVGTAGTTPTVASPMFKQAFDLRTGRCLTDPATSLRTYPVSCLAGVVRVGVGADVGHVDAGHVGGVGPGA
jgi:nitrite reductase (NADH) small subunit